MKPSTRILLCLVLGLLLAGCQSPSRNRSADGEPLPIKANDPAAVYLELATSYMAKGQPGAALVNARKAVAVDPENAEALIVQGMVQTQLGHVQDAEASYRKALEKPSGGPYAANAYGTYLCSQRRYDEAIVQFDAASADPENLAPWVAITNSGLCLSDQGNTQAAAQRFQKALQVNVRFGPALMGLSRLYYSAGNYDEARTHLNRYFEVSAPDPEGLWLGYRIEKARGNRQGAKSYEMMLRSRFPDAPQTQRLTGV